MTEAPHARGECAQCLVRRKPRPARDGFRGAGGRGRHPAGAQRRRQDDDDEVDHGPDAAPRRERPLPRRRDAAPAPRCGRARRHRTLPRGARHLRLPERDREFDAAAGDRTGRPRPADHPRAVPEPQGAGREPGHEALRRRAADAGDRAHPAHRGEPAAARRADRGTGAGDRAADRPHGARDQGARLHRAAGRAELPLRGDRRRSPLRHRARPRRRHDRKRSAGANMDKLHTYLGV